MGIDVNAAQLLIRARRLGIPFERVATLGRQGLHLPPKRLAALFRAQSWPLDTDVERRLTGSDSPFADDFLTALGAREVVAIDASAYEGASIVHDMNCPIPASLQNAFDVVFDGGTLEHVFHFPQAIENCMRLVRPGGVFLAFTPTNNFCGHGFYQFSPELWYRVLCPENGFRIESVVAWEDVPGSRFFEIPNPETMHSRVEFLTEKETYLFVQARKLEDIPLLAQPAPQQSDYVAAWSGPQGGKAPAPFPPGSWQGRLRELYHGLGVLKSLRSTVFQRLMDRAYRTGQLRANVRSYFRPLLDLRVQG